MLSFVPKTSKRILDLGTGDGRLLALLHAHCPEGELVGIDFSATMIEAASFRFAGDPRVLIREHDLEDSLPTDMQFDTIVFSFAIHHCPDSRKRTLYEEIYDRLLPRGIFCNLEHVASPTSSLHTRFLTSIGATSVSSQIDDWTGRIGGSDLVQFGQILSCRGWSNRLRLWGYRTCLGRSDFRTCATSLRIGEINKVMAYSSSTRTSLIVPVKAKGGL